MARTRRARIVWTKEQDALLRELYFKQSGVSLLPILDKAHVTQVTRRAEELGIKETTQRKPSVISLEARGTKYGRIKLIEPLKPGEDGYIKHGVMWRAECDCGRKFAVRAAVVISRFNKRGYVGCRNCYYKPEL